MYCKDCKWWEKKHCGNEEKIGENFYLDEEANIDQLSYSYTEGGGFQTGPLFGCVHFLKLTLDPRVKRPYTK